MTEGFKSTEFWLTALVVVGVVVLLALGKVTVDEVLKLWPVLGNVGVYALSRGIAKSRKGSV